MQQAFLYILWDEDCLPDWEKSAARVIPLCQNIRNTDGIASPCLAGITMTICSDYFGKLA